MHANAALTPRGRLVLVARIECGRPVAHVAAEMGVSRPTAYKWWRRFRDEGLDGLADRSSRPRTSPKRTSTELEAAIAELRTEAKLGPARLGPRLGVPPSTVHRVLRRLGPDRLRWLDRPTGAVVRRYEREAPGELVHVDVKKLGRIPDGGGWRVHGRGNDAHHGRSGVGFDFVHAAVDDHRRLAYAEALADERKETCVGFWERARSFFAAHGVEVAEVLTDNGSAYRSHAWREALGAAKHRRTRPRRPQTNGKVERFNRTLLEEWAYVQPYASQAERTAVLAEWLHLYNHHRVHTALGGQPPVSRVKNLPGHYS